MRISLARLQAHCDPFVSGVWDDKPLSRLAITRCLNAKQYETEFYDPPIVWRGLGPYKTRGWHNRRVAYLVANPDITPIEIDVGVPEVSGMLGRVPWFVQDGNHRLAAAIYRGDSYIEATVAGSVRYAESLFGRLKWPEAVRGNSYARACR